MTLVQLIYKFQVLQKQHGNLEVEFNIADPHDLGGDWYTATELENAEYKANSYFNGKKQDPYVDLTLR